MTISNGELMGDLLVGAVAIKMIDSTNNNHQQRRRKQPTHNRNILQPKTNGNSPF